MHLAVSTAGWIANPAWENVYPTDAESPERITTMKKPIDKRRKRADVPTVSKQQFVVEYEKAVRAFFGARSFSKITPARVIEDVIAGRGGPGGLLIVVAKQYGAKPGRVGNFLRGLR